MKIAYMVATPEVRRMPLAWCGPLPEIVDALATIGYDGVELQVRDPAKLSSDELVRTVRGAGLDFAAVSTGQVGDEDGIFLTSPEAEKRRRAVRRFIEILDFAASLGTGVSIGRFRGSLAWAPDRETGMTWFRRALDTLLVKAEERKTPIILEPQMRFNTDFLTTIAETVAFVRNVGSPYLVVEADLFHMSIEEVSLPAAIVEGARSGLLTYYQLSDSNRLAPGFGHLSWVDILGTIRATGYDGWLSIECLQLPSSRAAAEQAISCIGRLVRPDSGHPASA